MPILPQLKHIVVVMLENRSLDNMLGWLYPGGAAPPKLFLPTGSPAVYDGLRSDLWCPRNDGYFTGDPPDKVPIFQSSTSMSSPVIDPEEGFHDVTEQLYGTELPNNNPSFAMKGFVTNYRKALAAAGQGLSSDVEIMTPFSPAQVPVISAIARSYAVSDAWFCSAPTQTWPNRSFVHAGTSNGNVGNGNPLDFNVKTIFSVLDAIGASWKVYSGAQIAPSLTRTMFPSLWGKGDGHFTRFDDFVSDCANATLPAYSFIEPSFLHNPNDEHPPHDVTAGEEFLLSLWKALTSSPSWNESALIITYDEHGGTYDHVLPPTGAICPDDNSRQGQEGFGFDRFGVRVPMVVASPWIAEGTVFRSPTAVPYDHTSILATLRDWLAIADADMLTSLRAKAAPTLQQIFTLPQPRQTLPNIPSPGIMLQARAMLHEAEARLVTQPLNDLQASIVKGTAVRFSENPAIVQSRVKTRGDAEKYLSDKHMANK